MRCASARSSTNNCSRFTRAPDVRSSSPRSASLMITVLHLVTSLTRAGAESQLASLVRNTASAELSHIVCYLQRLDRWTARATTPRFIAISESVKRSAVRNLGLRAEDIRVIYNSIDPAILQCHPDEPSRIRKDAGIPSGAFVYLNVARLSQEKGQPVLLRAFKEVAASVAEAYLVIAGDGPRAAAYQTLATELGIHDRVRFLGSRTDVGACLEMADAFVFPSLFEGLGSASIEAMVKGRACIASRIEAMLEVFVDGKTGLLVTPGCEAALASAMMTLYRDPDLCRRLGASARAAALERFDSRQGIKAWSQFYGELASLTKTMA